MLLLSPGLHMTSTRHLALEVFLRPLVQLLCNVFREISAPRRSSCGSLASERQADDALCDFRVCYLGPGDDGMKFDIIPSLSYFPLRC